MFCSLPPRRKEPDESISVVSNKRGRVICLLVDHAYQTNCEHFKKPKKVWPRPCSFVWFYLNSLEAHTYRLGNPTITLNSRSFRTGRFRPDSTFEFEKECAYPLKWRFKCLANAVKRSRVSSRSDITIFCCLIISFLEERYTNRLISVNLHILYLMWLTITSRLLKAVIPFIRPSPGIKRSIIIINKNITDDNISWVLWFIPAINFFFSIIFLPSNSACDPHIPRLSSCIRVVTHSMTRCLGIV